MKKLLSEKISKKMIVNTLAFIIPIIILVGYVVYNQFMTDKDFFMRGNRFLTADMGGQYNALYNYIRNVFLGKDSIFYSFHNSLGGNMASTIGYYLASPFNILYILVPKTDIPLMTYIIYVLKISLCSLFMNIFLSHKFGERYANLIFSLTYAFMGFVVVYFFNNMWLDVIYMTPLVIMGIEKLIDGKPLMYIITLALSIIFNFYIAYMLCIFCVIYFIYELFIRYSIKEFKKYKRIILRFIISSLLAAGLSAFFLIPVLINLSQSMRTSVDKSMLSFDIYNFHNQWIQTVFSKTLIASNNRTSMLGRLRPVVYISFFSLVLSYLCFFNKKIKRKEKVLSLIIIIFFIMSFMIPYLQLFWQAGSLPNGYIDRYSFLYCFFLILLAAKCFYNKDRIKIIWFVLFIVIYSVLLYKLYNFQLSFLDKSDFIISFVGIIIYLVICFVYFNIKIKNLREFIFIIFLLVLTELVYNYRESIMLVKKMDYGKYYQHMCKEFNNIEDGFYRIDGDSYASHVDSFACDYYDSTTALSTSNAKLYDFYYKHGGSNTIIALYNDSESMPILNSILGIQYIIYHKKLNNNQYNYIKKIINVGGFSVKEYSYLYRNNDALSIGYVIDKNFSKKYKLTDGDGLKNLNSFMKAITGEEKNILNKIPKQFMGEQNLYNFYIDNDDKYLFISPKHDISLNFATRYEIFVNNKRIKSFDDARIGVGRIKNNYYNQFIMVKLEYLPETKIYDYNLYYFDENEFKKMVKKLKRESLQNVVVQGNKLQGNINLDKSATMLLTIPYDKGWEIYVDGKKTQYNEIANAFIGVKLNKGYHKIKMIYYSNGILFGIIITFLSNIGIILYCFYLKNASVKKQQK